MGLQANFKWPSMRAKMTLPNLQLYPWNPIQIKNVEDIVVSLTLIFSIAFLKQEMRGDTANENKQFKETIEKGNEEVKLTSDVHNRPPY